MVYIIEDDEFGVGMSMRSDRRAAAPRIAKLFLNGRSQAVRLPSEFRFEGLEVFIRRDPDTGDVILSRKPGSWDSYFALMESIEVPADFMADRGDLPPQDRDPL